MTQYTRRALLRRTALAGGVAALAGCGGRDGEDDPDSDDLDVTVESTRPDSGPRTVPSAVHDLARRWEFDSIAALGADTSDPLPIDDVLERSVSDGTLLFLDPGRYRLTDIFAFDEFERFGIVGRDATLVPPDGYNDPVLLLGSPDRASQVLVQGLEFDFRAESTGGRPLGAMASDRLVVRDVTVTGQQDVNSDMVRVDVTGSNGKGLVERLRLPDGGVPGSWDGDSGITGCEVGSKNRGDVRFVDCHIEGFPDNGLYAGPTEGQIEVIGGYYANNGVANVRINAGAGSAVRGVHVRCDEAREGVPNMRGIRLRGGAAPVVENCLIELDTVTGSDGAITVHDELAAATVRNCRIRVDADEVPAIRIKSPSSETPADGTIALQNLLVEGSSNGGATVQASERKDVQLERTCLRQTGPGRDGIQAYGIDGRVANSLIAVRGRPLALQESNVETIDVQMNRQPRALSNLKRGSCHRG